MRDVNFKRAIASVSLLSVIGVSSAFSQMTSVNVSSWGRDWHSFKPGRVNGYSYSYPNGTPKYNFSSKDYVKNHEAMSYKDKIQKEATKSNIKTLTDERWNSHRNTYVPEQGYAFIKKHNGVLELERVYSAKGEVLEKTLRHGKSPFYFIMSKRPEELWKNFEAREGKVLPSDALILFDEEISSIPLGVPLKKNKNKG